MNYTEHYHLPQWKKDDRIMMEDFNAAMANLESGITNAQETAEDAKAEAVRLPYAVGSYVGTGELNRHITLGFRPRFVLVGAPVERDAGGTGLDFYAGFTSGGALPLTLQLTDDGFTVNPTLLPNFPELNYKDYTYDYIAFR
ncbi:MAG: hypothetical protein K2P20_02305 [Oscillospiraceae bacterium]|nr:hypothetical protein [Oscillospiraceae bacterium]